MHLNHTRSFSFLSVKICDGLEITEINPLELQIKLQVIVTIWTLLLMYYLIIEVILIQSLRIKTFLNLNEEKNIALN